MSERIPLEIKQMEIEDFLSLMSLNSDIYPEFAALSEETKRFVARLNIVTGTAESFFQEGKLVGVGGIRYVGIGEGWIITTPRIRKEGALTLLKSAKHGLTETARTKKLWRIFAESRISETFMKHLGFEKAERMHVWTRL